MGSLVDASRAGARVEVTDVVIFGAALGGMFQLESHVSNLILVMQQVLHLVGHIVQVPGKGRVHQDVGGKGHIALGNGPDVDIVDQGNTLKLFEVVAQGINCLLYTSPSPRDS